MIVPSNILRGGNKGSIYLNDDASIYTPATILSSETNILTFAAWAKFDPSSARTFFSTANQSKSLGFIWIYYAVNNRLNYQFATGTSILTVISFRLTDIIKEEWNHYTFICNYNTSSVSFFINGNLLNTNTISASIFPNQLNQLYIGRYNSRHWQIPNTYFSNAKIYGRELTENEIKLLYKGVNISNNSLIGSWAMNETQGEIAYDRSGNNLHGTILNGIWTPDKPY